MIIIDIFNLIYRALGTASNIEEKDYLYGSFEKTFYQVFFKMFNRIYRVFKDKKIYIAWEGGERNFRYDIYSEYKANREGHLKGKIGDDYYAGLKEGLRNYGAVILEYDFAEADDIIYNFCSLADGKEVLVISSDEDYIQLLQQFENIKLFNPVKKEYLIAPTYDYVRYKAIKGDNSDNIKGLFGFGDVKARNVLNNYDVFWSSLNEESKNLIVRNISLIDLSKNPENEKIKEYIKEELSTSHEEFSFKNIKDFVMKYRLKDIYANLNYELNNFI